MLKLTAITTAYQHGYYTNFRNRIWVVVLPFQTLFVCLKLRLHVAFKPVPKPVCVELAWKPQV